MLLETFARLLGVAKLSLEPDNPSWKIEWDEYESGPPVGLPKDNEGNDQLKSVNYAHLTSVLIEAVKELSTELEAAKARITTLEG